ncbi:hypothetical protein [Halorussus lipolyticus]|uniref:hypothetical protein n=1 Tax=Halorussus lipolyticus TaxID=3034024 RepID=UPI0023E7F95F|nr:hypothetical protein [Halorussus sp. DT80]
MNSETGFFSASVTSGIDLLVFVWVGEDVDAEVGLSVRVGDDVTDVVSDGETVVKLGVFWKAVQPVTRSIIASAITVRLILKPLVFLIYVIREVNSYYVY